MRKVLLCGGTNDRRVMDIKHGNELIVAKLHAAWPRSFEKYVRPEAPVVTDGMEHWVLKQS